MEIKDFDFTRNGVLRNEERRRLALHTTSRSAEHGLKEKKRWFIPDWFSVKGPLSKLCSRMDVEDPFRGYERKDTVIGSTYDIAAGNEIIQEYKLAKTRRCDCCGCLTMSQSYLCPDCKKTIGSQTDWILKRMEE